MNLEQFKFKKSGMLGFTEEATVKTNRNDFVMLLKKDNRITVRKYLNGKFHCQCSFDVEKNKQELTKYLKNISKK